MRTHKIVALRGYQARLTTSLPAYTRSAITGRVPESSPVPGSRIDAKRLGAISQSSKCGHLQNAYEVCLMQSRFKFGGRPHDGELAAAEAFGHQRSQSTGSHRINQAAALVPRPTYGSDS